MSETRSERSTAEEEEAILTVVRRLLDTIAHRDKAGLIKLLVPEGCATLSRDHQVSHTQLRDFPGTMPGGTSRMEERFSNVLVRTDDDVAVVLAQYDFLVDGEVHHWGTSILNFLKQDGQWRICAITDTGRSGPRPDGTHHTVLSRKSPARSSSASASCGQRASAIPAGG
jgi:uncharacterized protein DUF4440